MFALNMIELEKLAHQVQLQLLEPGHMAPMFDATDAAEVIASAGDEIWVSMGWYGKPDVAVGAPVPPLGWDEGRVTHRIARGCDADR